MIVPKLLNVFDDLTGASDQIPALRRLMFACVLHEAVNAPDAQFCADKLRELHETQRIKTKRKSSQLPAVTQDELPPGLASIHASLFERLENIASIEKGLSQIQSTKLGKHPLVVTAETRSTSDSWNFEGPAAIVPLVSSTGHGDASLKRIHYQEGRYAVGNILAVIQPLCPNAIQARFLYEYLSSFKDQLLVSRMVGTANVSLTINKLKEVPVPLVTGKTLQRIDELMGLCDRLESEQKEREAKHAVLARAALVRFAEAPTPASLEYLFHPSFHIDPADLRKSILTMAVQGKLVLQDPNDKPAKTIVGLNAEFKAEAPFDIPNHWTWTKLSQIAEINGGFAFKSTAYTDQGMRVVRISDFDEFGFRNHKVVRHPFSSDLQKFTLAEQNILMAMTGGTVGKSYFVHTLPEPMVVNQRVATIKVTANAYPSYVDAAIRSELTQEVIRKVKNSTNDNISMGDIKGFIIPLPPLAEQRRIVAKVELLMGLVDRLEVQLAESCQLAAGLLAAAVAELTDQE